MKINTITKIMKKVKVTISNAALFDLFIDAIYDDAQNATGKDLTFYNALGSLVGISDKEAVEIANHNTKKEHCITVTEFRRRLPTVFAEFARAVLEGND